MQPRCARWKLLKEPVAEVVCALRTAAHALYACCTRAVGDSVSLSMQGGMVLLSPFALAQYNGGGHGGGGGGRSGGADGPAPMLLHMGRHALSKAGQEPLELVMVG